MSQTFSSQASRSLMVVPCYNESERFNVDYWKSILSHSPKIQWLFVNDGSQDRTSSIIDAMLEFGAITLHLDKNCGKAEAIRRGILHSETLKVFFYSIGYVDADMAFDSDELVKFCEESCNLLSMDTNLDCQIASRVKLAGSVILRSTLRHYLSRIVATGFGFFWSDIPYDTQCGLKVFRKTHYFEKAVSSPFATRWLFDIELMTRISSIKGERINVLERPLKHWGEVGQSKIDWKETFRIFKEIMYVSRLLFTLRNQ